MVRDGPTTDEGSTMIRTPKCDDRECERHIDHGSGRKQLLAEHPHAAASPSVTVSAAAAAVLPALTVAAVLAAGPCLVSIGVSGLGWRRSRSCDHDLLECWDR
jgi:hypothetical protein